MSDRKISYLRKPTDLVKVGGPVDESSATLAVYGEDLDPDDVSAILKIAPTSSFARGYKKGPRSPPMPHGAWFLEVRGYAPDGPEVQLRALLSKLPDSSAVWIDLGERYKVQIRIGLFLEGWNRGFAIDHESIDRIARMGVDIEWDIYADHVKA